MDYIRFSIGRQSGVIRTAATFDCEMKKEYYITVVAEDGAPSDRPNHYPSGTPNQGTIALYITLAAAAAADDDDDDDTLLLVFLILFFLSHCLHSASSPSLIVRRTRLSTVGDRAFPVATSRVWKDLPQHVTAA